MTTKFRDVLQCINGPRKGLLAQIIDVHNGEVELLCRPLDGEAAMFKMPTTDLVVWEFIGVARVGPPPKTTNALEPENATRPAERPEDSSPSPIASPVPSSPLAPLKLDELMEPLPSDIKAVPLTDPPVWPVPEPEPTREQAKVIKRRAKVRRRRSNPIPSKRYTALVTNGAGDQARVTYSLRSGLEPTKFIAGAIVKARQVIPDIRPWKVEEIKEGS